MLPLSCKESVKHTDDDGIEYVFKPKTGDLEIELLEIYDSRESTQISEWVKRMREFFKKIVVSVKDPKNGFSSNDFINSANGQEQSRVIEIWHKANSLTVEEKKT